jgi:hypothetical protein
MAARIAEAQYHADRREKARGRLLEPALDALKPALAKQLPTALDAGTGREIDRALALAAEFGLDPIVVGAGRGRWIARKSWPRPRRG